MVQNAPVQVGEILANKFRVERVLGQGGMGVVVEAWHLQLEQRVALKFLLSEGASDSEVNARFMREAKASARLKSEHAAKVLDVGQLGSGAPYIVMEYLDGHDLEHALDEAGTLPVALAVDYVLQACEAIAEAHAAGIVHRDLKPANLFLTRGADGSPCIKVLDFGISKNIEANATDNGMTKTKAMLGTPYFMSPEQMRSSRKVDQRADIWALGMILCQLTTGHTTFERDTLAELCAAVLTEPPDLPSKFNPSIPGELEAIILKCLEKDADNRYPDLSALCHELAPLGSGGSLSASRISRVLGQPSGKITPGPASRVGSAPVTPPRVSVPPSDATLQADSPAGPRPSTAHALTVAPDTAMGHAPASPRVKILGGAVVLAGALAAAAILATSQRNNGTPGASTTATQAPSAAPSAPLTASATAATATASATATVVVVPVASAEPAASATAAAKPATTPAGKGPGKTAPPAVTKKPGMDEFGGRK